MKSAKKAAQKPKNTAAPGKKTGFTDEERAAMRDRVQEMKAEGRAAKADGEGEVLAKIAEMPEPDRVMAERLHAIIKASAPTLSPRTWYGMPAYAKDGKVILLLPKRAQAQVEVRDVRFRPGGKPRRR